MSNGESLRFRVGRIDMKTINILKKLQELLRDPQFQVAGTA